MVFAQAICSSKNFAQAKPFLQAVEKQILTIFAQAKL
jgi:hypothetical protein